MCVRYCVLKSITIHIDHYTVHIPRGGKFTIGGVTTNKHKLLSLESKQSNTYHSDKYLESKQSNTYHCDKYLIVLTPSLIAYVYS